MPSYYTEQRALGIVGRAVCLFSSPCLALRLRPSRRASLGYNALMEQIILNIIELLRSGEQLDERTLVKLIHAEARREKADKSKLAKRHLLPFYQRVKRDDPQRWRSWNVTPELEERLLRALRMKPRRSASGVATITVIAKPWPCGSDCLYCPNDIRMPKSYLHAEPACARAEQNYFDPYLQVSARLTALSQMGHATDKIELIVLGGTWSDYPRAYQVWFMRELFCALNDDAISDVSANPQLNDGPYDPDALDEGLPEGVRARRARYRAWGFTANERCLHQASAHVQRSIDEGTLTYNQAHARIYGASAAWGRAAEVQSATLDELFAEQKRNEQARHRVVGLVVETRPDAVTPEALTLIRQLGCTKVQMGVQSTMQKILDANARNISLERIEYAFELLRIFGFKIHAHAMANLLGATPQTDKRDYVRLMSLPALQPDEVKLYPCALIESARLRRCFEAGTWRPYSEDELLDVLVDDVMATPSFCRISRMIRDFSSEDIMVGNKKPNLRQLVEQRLRAQGAAPAYSGADAKNVQPGDDSKPAAGAALHPDVREIRFREVGTKGIGEGPLVLDDVAYATSNTQEHFLQWVTPEGRIAGFLRLSLPDVSYVDAHARELAVKEREAMIREVHVYGMATPLAEAGHAAQHRGLGRALVERACEMAREAGYERINVISAIGTREYYRHLGFYDNGLYQQRRL